MRQLTNEILIEFMESVAYMDESELISIIEDPDTHPLVMEVAGCEYGRRITDEMFKERKYSELWAC